MKDPDVDVRKGLDFGEVESEVVGFTVISYGYVVFPMALQLLGFVFHGSAFPDLFGGVGQLVFVGSSHAIRVLIPFCSRSMVVSINLNTPSLMHAI